MGSHAYGRRAKEAVEKARVQLAKLINAKPENIVFTSGGTEANNFAIKAVADLKKRGHFIISAIEHACVFNSCEYLKSRGFTTTIVPVDENGLVDPAKIKKAIKKDTILISVMHSNNETGTLQPIKELAKIVDKNKIFLLTDAVQSVGKAPVDVEDLKVDLLSLSAHKFNGPQGIGALYIRDPKHFLPFFHGAGHEGGLRSGTQDVLSIVGLGAAAERCLKEKKTLLSKYKELRNYFESNIQKAISGVRINCKSAPRLVNTSNLTIEGISAFNLLNNIPEIAASMGATCHTGDPKPSRVLTAIGISPEECASTIRISIGLGTTKSDLDRAIKLLKNQIAAQRRVSAIKV